MTGFIYSLIYLIVVAIVVLILLRIVAMLLGAFGVPVNPQLWRAVQMLVGLIFVLWALNLFVPIPWPTGVYRHP